MVKKFFTTLVIACCVSSVFAQPAPNASVVLADAYKVANASNKKVFLIFHASWCAWCKKMDRSMQDPVCKKFFDDHFVITHLVVDESKENQHLENPGADAVRDRLNGQGMGIPYWAILDSNGKLLDDSKIRTPSQAASEGENAGCPATEKEVEFFIDLLKKHTNLKEAELDIIRTRFRANEK